MKIERLRVQGLENPLGLTEQTPVFSYRLVRSGGETGEAALQSACRILAASSPEKLARGEGDLWLGRRAAGSRQPLLVEGAGVGRRRP